MEDLNSLHYTIAIGSPQWIGLNLGLVIGFILVFAAAYKANEKRLNIIAWILAIIIGGNHIAGHIEALYNGVWEAKTHLPFHLCSFSAILSVLTLIFRKQWMYEFLIFWSAGAVHAFITPEITDGHTTFNLFEFGIAHGGIIITGFFATLKLKFRPRDKSYWKVFLYTQLTLPVVGLINYLIGSNYMYIAQKPNANNPMIMGEWPWYIIGLEVVVLAHFLAFYWIHRRASRVHWNMEITDANDPAIQPTSVG